MYRGKHACTPTHNELNSHTEDSTRSPPCLSWLAVLVCHAFGSQPAACDRHIRRGYTTLHVMYAANCEYSFMLLPPCSTLSELSERWHAGCFDRQQLVSG